MTRFARDREIVLGALGIFAGIVHLVLAGPHFGEARWLGAVFLLDGAALAGAGIWLLFDGTEGIKRTAAVIAALTAFAYVASRTIGLPGMERETWDPLGLATTIAELMIVAAWPLFARHQAVIRIGPTKDERRDV